MIGEDKADEKYCDDVLMQRLTAEQANMNHHKCIGLLLDTNSLDKLSIGSGFLISRQLVVTVAHNVFDRATNKRSKGIVFYPGINEFQIKDNVAGIKVTQFYFPEQYKTSNDHNSCRLYDYAILKLEKPVQVQSYIKLGMNIRQGNQTLFVYGYNKQSITIYKNKLQRALQMGLEKSNSLVKIQNNTSIIHKVSTTGGNSGSPIMARINGELVAIGIHQGNSNETNEGRYIQNKLIDNLITWLYKLKIHSAIKIVVEGRQEQKLAEWLVYGLDLEAQLKKGQEEIKKKQEMYEKRSEEQKKIQEELLKKIELSQQRNEENKKRQEEEHKKFLNDIQKRDQQILSYKKKLTDSEKIIHQINQKIIELKNRDFHQFIANKYQQLENIKKQIAQFSLTKDNFFKHNQLNQKLEQIKCFQQDTFQELSRLTNDRQRIKQRIVEITQPKIPQLWHEWKSQGIETNEFAFENNKKAERKNDNGSKLVVSRAIPRQGIHEANIKINFGQKPMSLIVGLITENLIKEKECYKSKQSININFNPIKNKMCIFKGTNLMKQMSFKGSLKQGVVLKIAVIMKQKKVIFTCVDESNSIKLGQSFSQKQLHLCAVMASKGASVAIV